MMIKVSDIPPEGIEQELCDVIPVPGITLEAPVCGKLSWRRVGARVLVSGSAGTVVWLTCSRCLEAFTQAVETDVSVEYLPIKERTEVEEHELGAGELDVTYYTGDTIDSRDLLREQVLLGIPMSPVCREECKGFCPRCGTDLNTGSCDCGDAARDSRFSALADLKKRL